MNIGLSRRRELRRHCTDAEGALWAHLRAKRLGGVKFRRQHPFGPYILDFYCVAKRLAVELDGGQHYQASARAYDDRRTAYLNRGGVTVLPFATDLVFRERAAVLETIARAVGVADRSP